MKCKLGQIEIDNVSMKEAVSLIVRMAQKSEIPRLVCTANMDHLATTQRDPDFLSIYQNADLVVADGMPLVWLSKLSRFSLKERVAGSDLFWELGRASAATGIRLFLLGGQLGTAVRAGELLEERYPTAQVVGTYCPPFGSLNDEAEISKILAAVSSATPDVLLVGFGSPKQEKWISTYKGLLGVPVSIGVGASFDMAAGVVRRAPNWMQCMGLEWVFRLAQEPGRLWRRYLGRDLRYFVWLLVTILAGRVAGLVSGKRVLDHSK